MRYILFLDPMQCTGCRTCEIACSLHHEGECNPEKSRIRIVKKEMEAIYTPITCLHCEEAFCKSVCPVKALDTDPKTGGILLNEDVCIGCKLCVYVCPIGAPLFDPERGKVVKCDLCGGDPYCVKFCEAGTIQYVPVDKLDMLRKRIGASKIMEFQARMTRVPAAGAEAYQERGM